MFLQQLQFTDQPIQFVGVDLKVIFTEKISETSRLTHVNGHEFVILKFEAFLRDLHVLADEQVVDGLSAALVHVVFDYDL